MLCKFHATKFVKRRFEYWQDLSGQYNVLSMKKYASCNAILDSLQMYARVIMKSKISIFVLQEMKMGIRLDREISQNFFSSLFLENKSPFPIILVKKISH